MRRQKTWLASALCLAMPSLLGGHASAVQLMAPPVSQDTQAQAQTAVVVQLDARRQYRGMDPHHGFKVRGHHPGVAGTAIMRVAHTYKGVRVFHSESLVVSNQAGAILAETRADRSAGLDQNSVQGGGGFSTTPIVSSAAALDVAVKASAPLATHAAAPVIELIIYPVVGRVRTAAAATKPEAQLNALDLVEQVTGYELAYLVQTRMVNGTRPYFYDTVVSANDGRILAQWRTLKTVAGTGKSQYNGTVPLNTTLSGGTYTLKDPSRGVGGAFGGLAITNANHGSSAGALYASTTNVWGDGLQYIAGGSTTNANGQTAAVNAMWGLVNTYDMLKNVLGWQSLDGNNTATYIAAHVNTAYDNAYYSDACRCMYIGDGNAFKSLGAIDVIGHEMGHGITAATSNLSYWGESGGLNESASDINGEMVEAYARAGGTGNMIPNTGNDWQMGTEISKTGTPLRYMYKPSLDGGSPNAWSSTLGNLDVHYSSGPNNRMFYFLSQGSNATPTSNYYSAYLTQLPKAMSGIGSDKAYRIWFRALTTKFTASTNYADARAKVLLAAQELYGVGSKEAIAVQRAYAAINVGADVAEATAVAIATQPASVSVVAGASAAFTVAASGGTAPYKYQWLRNGAAIAGATGASYSLVTKTADSGAVFSVKVSDAAATPTSATSANATLTVTVPTVAIASQPASVNVLAGASATFAVTASGGTAPYKYQWLRNGTAIAGATAASYGLVTKAADSGAVFSVKVSDAAATPTSATSANATLTVTVPTVAIASQPASVNVLAGASATFAVAASGGTAPYKYQWLRNGAAIAGATAASYGLVTKAADSGAVFSVKVSDAAATPTSATSANATLTVTVPMVAIASQPSSVSVLAGASATFAVTASGGTAPYKYQWLRNGVAIAGATAASYSLVTKAADSGAVFSVKVSDAAATPTSAISANATLTVTLITATERIVNGGFEAGVGGWSGTVGVIGAWPGSGQVAAAGSQFAYLGGNGTLTVETLAQAVALPATATSATLSFALHIDSAETTTSMPYDRLEVAVRNTAGTVLGTLATYSNLNKAAGYTTRSFNLLPYKGQTVILTFVMVEDSVAQTSFTLDKVSLTTQ